MSNRPANCVYSNVRVLLIDARLCLQMSRAYPFHSISPYARKNVMILRLNHFWNLVDNAKWKTQALSSTNVLSMVLLMYSKSQILLLFLVAFTPSPFFSCACSFNHVSMCENDMMRPSFQVAANEIVLCACTGQGITSRSITFRRIAITKVFRHWQTHLSQQISSFNFRSFVYLHANKLESMKV